MAEVFDQFDDPSLPPNVPRANLSGAAAFLRPTARQTSLRYYPGGSGEADVDDSDPNTINVHKPSSFTPPVQSHELTHVLQNNLRPETRKMMARDPKGDAYDYGGQPGLLRAQQQRRNITNFGPEQQASIVQGYQDATWKAMQAADPRSLAAANKAYQPFVQQLADLPWKGDSMKTINTRVVPPPGFPSFDSETGRPIAGSVMAPSRLIGGATRLGPLGNTARRR